MWEEKARGTRVWDLAECSPVFSCEEEIGSIFPSIRNIHDGDILVACPAQELIRASQGNSVI